MGAFTWVCVNACFERPVESLCKHPALSILKYSFVMPDLLIWEPMAMYDSKNGAGAMAVTAFLFAFSYVIIGTRKFAFQNLGAYKFV